MIRKLLLALFAASSLKAQTLSTFPRITPTTGLADSSLFYCTDSTKTLTRACKFSLIQQRLSYKAFDSLVTTSIRLPGTLNLTGGTVSGTPTWSSAQTFAAGQRVDSATGAARASALVGSPAITVSSCTGCGGSTDPIRLANNSAAAPGYSFTNSTGLGLYRFGADTLGVATAGVLRAQFMATGFRSMNGVKVGGSTAGIADSGLTFMSTDGLTVRGGLWCSHPGTCTLKANTVSSLIANQGSGTLTLDAGAGESILIGSTAASGIAFTTSAAQSAEITGGASPIFSLGGAGAGANQPLVSFEGGSGSGGGGWMRWSRGGSVKGYFGSDAAIRGTTSDSLIWYGESSNPLILVAKAKRVATLVDSQFRFVDGRVAKPAFGFINDTTTGLYRIGASDTLGVAVSGVVHMRVVANGGSDFWLGGTGGSADLTIRSGTGGGNRGIIFQTVNGSSQVKNSLSLTASDSGGTMLGTFTARDFVDAGNGSAASPGFRFASSGNGIFDASGIGIGVNGRQTAFFPDSQSQMVKGRVGKPAYSFNTGATTGLYLGDNGSTDTLGFVASGSVFARGFADTLIVPSKLKALGLTAEPSTQSDLCIDATTFQVYINAAANCTVSARRFKTNIQPLDPILAHRIVVGSNPVTFEYKSGGGKAIGLVAEEADSLDHRLATRDGQGRINSVNYEQFTVALLVEVRQMQALARTQQKTIDSLIAVVKKGKP